MIQLFLVKGVKVFKYLRNFILKFYSKTVCVCLFYLNRIKFKSFKVQGFPYVNVSISAKCSVGGNFQMNNGVRFSDSGLNGKCRIDVRDSAILTIGENVGMSDTTITCHEKITIGDNVLLGVGCQIRDTDNHSLNYKDRLIGLDWKNKKTAPIIIEDNVFIGAYAFVLKGVKIGANSIIGANSVVTKNIPSNQIWAGNPAKLVKQLKK